MKDVFEYEALIPPDQSEKQPYAYDLYGMFKTTSTVPTDVPTTWYDQVRIYKNGSTLRFYWYDATERAWHYVTATA